ncbi:hypothetical protein [Achromobacter sp. SLBN-14]|uniref:hypothetical protein n=1 Tax=Achromobacter sp. SLBN-14 TaxID=2768442 RepID=UPI001151C84E|nr:hypothetical protein [Achromobacter sp. SLBN-14]TQJ94665.1 hypothetical protein FBY20_1401 [Achromobacter sp. SLBN-14]
MVKLADTAQPHSPTRVQGWLTLFAAMFASAQTWFWIKKTSEFGDIVVSEFDKYGPFYWNALVCFIALFFLGILATLWGCVAQHLLGKLRARMFPSAKVIG